MSSTRTKIEPSTQLLTMRLDVVSFVKVGSGMKRVVMHGLYAMDYRGENVIDVDLNAEYYVDDIYHNTVSPDTVVIANGMRLRVWVRYYDDKYEFIVMVNSGDRPVPSADKPIHWTFTYILSVQAVDNMVYIDVFKDEYIVRMVLTM